MMPGKTLVLGTACAGWVPIIVGVACLMSGD